MSSTIMYRLSGIALGIGGVLAVIGTLGEALDNEAFGPFWTPSAIVTAIGLLLIVLGLPALYARQSPQAGRFGAFGFVLFFVASIVFAGSSGLTDLVLLPWINHLAPSALDNPPLAFILYFLIAKALVLVGSVVFGIALLRAGVFSKASAILLLAGSVLFVVGGRVPYLSYIGEALFFVALIWLGATLLASLQRGAAMPASVGASARA